MALPSWLLVSVGGRRFQCPGPSTISRSLGPSHQRCHKSWVSLRGLSCTHGVAGTPHKAVRDTHPHQMESMSTLTILVVGTPILKLSFSLRMVSRTPSLGECEAFPMPGAFTHSRITWALSPMVPQVPGATQIPLVSMVFQALLMERLATH